jgi:hypothetical protein
MPGPGEDDGAGGNATGFRDFCRKMDGWVLIYDRHLRPRMAWNPSSRRPSVHAGPGPERPKACERTHSHALARSTYISTPSRAEAETLRAGVAGGVSVHLELRPSLSAAALLKESMHG